MRGAGELVPMVPEILPGVQYTIELFVSQLIRRLALRFADDLDPLTGSSMDAWQHSPTTGDSRVSGARSQQVPGATNGWATQEKQGSDSWDHNLL